MSLIGIFHRYTCIFHGYSGISVVFRYFGDSCDPPQHICLKKNMYGKCPKISYNKVSYKKEYANNADLDQTAPGAV